MTGADLAEVARLVRERGQMPESDIARGIITVVAERHGHVFRQRAARPPRAGPYGECWTNAWNLVAHDRRLRYCEGVAVLDDEVLHAHAWAIDKRGRVHEATQTYRERTREYRGWPLSTAEVSRITAGWVDFDVRCSILEGLVAAGLDGAPRGFDLFVKLAHLDGAAADLSTPPSAGS